jgi:uncharacterized protein (DUF3084 family)
MFNDKIFDEWLDKKAYQIIEALGEGKALSSEEMMILVLKAQTNHFNHLDVDLREDMKLIREDMNSESKKLREDMKLIREDMNSESKKLREDMQLLREDMNSENKKLREDMNKRFEQVDKRFDAITTRMDRFMIWSFATTISASGIVIAAIKLLP